MTLPIVLFIASLGITTIVTLVHLLGGTPTGTVGDADAVAARYRRDVVGSSPAEVVVSDDGLCALVDDPEVGVAAVVARGSGVVIRPLGPAADLVPTPEGLEVHPHDLLLAPFVVRGRELDGWITRHARVWTVTP